MEIQAGAEEFYLPGTGTDGALLIHGYTGSPPEMRLLGDYLQGLGYTVLGVRLPGHGTTPQDLGTKRWPDWYGAVAEGMARLGRSCRRLFLVGQSLGGLLALKAAAERPVTGLALLATPMFVQDWRAPFVKLASFFIKEVRRNKYTYNVSPRYNMCYQVLPVKPLPSLFELIRLCKEEYLPQVTAPVLIVQSTREHTVQSCSASYIYDHLPGNVKQLLWVEHSGHAVTLGDDREEVYQAIGCFFKKIRAQAEDSAGKVL